jgi:oligopeptide transport system ATP-binding protein
MTETKNEVILELKNFKKHFPIQGGIISRTIGYLKAVDGVNLQVQKGEIFGIVGESGCGKTTLGKSLLHLIKPTSGEVIFKGKNISKLSPRNFRPFRRDLQIIFQDPFSSLHPRMRIDSLISEPLKIHGMHNRSQIQERVRELIRLVGLDRYHLRKYPHEFSGGQQQRIVIARALALNPGFIVCDEPVSALDVSIQSQIINLLKELRTKLNLTYMFISHNLAVIRHISDRVGVMYLGKLVEVAEVDEIYKNPLHPYTEALFSAIPVTDPSQRKERIILQGNVPSPVDIPPGCRFQGRCKHVMDKCRDREPDLIECGDGHLVRCYLH